MPAYGRRYTPFLLSKPVKVMVLALFFAYLGVSITGAHGHGTACRKIRRATTMDSSKKWIMCCQALTASWDNPQLRRAVHLNIVRYVV